MSRILLNEALEAVNKLILWCRQNPGYEDFELDLMSIEDELKKDED